MSDFNLKDLKERIGNIGEEKKRESVLQVLEEIAHQDELLQEDLIQLIKEETGYTKTVLRKKLNRIEKRIIQEDMENNPEENDKKEKVDEKEVEDWLSSPDLLKKIDQELGQEMVGEKRFRKICFLSLLTAFTDQRVHLRIAGESSSGKSYVMNKVAKFFPPEAFVVRRTRVTPAYLEYALQGKDLDGKILIVQEYEGARGAEVSIRPMLSGDQEGISLGTVERVNGEIKAREIEAQGVPVFLTASTQLILDQEFETRTWKVEPDKSTQQTREILKFEAAENNSDKVELIREVVRKIKDWSLDVQVKIPFSLAIAENFPVAELRIRRDFKKFLTFIKAHALLHAHSRPYIAVKEGRDLILATDEDYEKIRKLLQPSFELTVKDFSTTMDDILDYLRESGGEVSTRELVTAIGKSANTVRDYLRRLHQIGLVEVTSDPEDRRRNLYRAKGLEKQRLIHIPKIREIIDPEQLQSLLSGEPEKNEILFRLLRGDTKNQFITNYKSAFSMVPSIFQNYISFYLDVPKEELGDLSREELARELKVRVNRCNSKRKEQSEKSSENRGGRKEKPSLSPHKVLEKIDHLSYSSRGAHKSELQQELKVDDQKFEEILDFLLQRGEIFESDPEHVKKVG